MLLLVDRPALLGKGGGVKSYSLDDFKEEVYGGKVRRMWLMWLWLMLLVPVIMLLIMMMMIIIIITITIISIIIIIMISGCVVVVDVVVITNNNTGAAAGAAHDEPRNLDHRRGVRQTEHSASRCRRQ
jgi:hypothetical protein